MQSAWEEKLFRDCNGESNGIEVTFFLVLGKQWWITISEPFLGQILWADDRSQFSLHIQLYHSCNKYGFNFSNNFQLPEETKAAELEASNNGL